MKFNFKKLIYPKFYITLPSTIKFILNRFYHERFFFKVASNEAVFTSIWRNNYWGSTESISGPGSTLTQTKELRQKIPRMIQEFGIKSVFDTPCGDMHWMQHLLKNPKFTYLGGDIVSEIIEKNKAKLKREGVDFQKFDITSDVFPDMDLWLCRAVLFHLSNRDIFLALENFLESNIKYILTTNCVTDRNHINKDIATGDWRSLNLMLPPFSFPEETLWEIDDFVDPHPPMKLSLWTRDQIKAILPNLRQMYLQ